MATPEVSIEGPRHRSRAPWIASAVLFITSAALLTVRSMPSNMAGEVLSVLSWSVTISFGLACALAAVALWGGSSTRKRAAVAIACFGVWVLVAPLLLNVFAADPMLIVDALIKIVTGGAAAGLLLRSDLPSSWRALPVAVLGVVIAGTLLMQLGLSSDTTMDAAILGDNFLLLARIGASVVLGIVALRFSRASKTSTDILGTHQ